jgi:alkanesulfonate monooxygenase SsuD/methylene tetrahydromethanopterin reductase-like flavin-dependent oxidoreductase (luciferase family)
MADKIHTYGADGVTDFFVDLQVWGTPAQCYEKILDVRDRVGNDHYVGVFSYAGMPWDEAERNMRLFAREVVPALQKLGPAERSRTAVAPPDGKGVSVGLLGS